jgi:hypothetical protein
MESGMGSHGLKFVGHAATNLNGGAEEQLQAGAGIAKEQAALTWPGGRLGYWHSGNQGHGAGVDGGR